MRCEIGISNVDRGGSRYLPHAFIEQGVAMLSSVLRSERAVQVNIAAVRVFVRLRELMVSNKQLAGKFAELEARVAGRDEAIQNLFEAMLADPPGPKRVIGFNRQNEKLTEVSCAIRIVVQAMRVRNERPHLCASLRPPRTRRLTNPNVPAVHRLLHSHPQALILFPAWLQN